MLVESSRYTLKPEDKKLSCRREAAWRSVSLELLLRHSVSLKVIRYYTAEYGVCLSFC